MPAASHIFYGIGLLTLAGVAYLILFGVISSPWYTERQYRAQLTQTKWNAHCDQIEDPIRCREYAGMRLDV